MSEQATDNGQSAQENSIMSLIHEKIHEEIRGRKDSRKKAIAAFQHLKNFVHHPN